MNFICLTPIRTIVRQWHSVVSSVYERQRRDEEIDPAQNSDGMDYANDKIF